MKSFSSGEVAKYCDVNPRTVIRWIEAGKLKAFKLPGRGNNRVKHNDLLAFLEQNQIPIPYELNQEQEKLCFIVSKDKNLVKHAQRIARNSGFVTHVHPFGLDAGIEISTNKPALIIVDYQTSRISSENMMETIKNNLDYTPHLIVLDEGSLQRLEAQHNSTIYTMSKPLDNYTLSMVLDNITEHDRDAVA